MRMVLYSLKQSEEIQKTILFLNIWLKRFSNNQEQCKQLFQNSQYQKKHTRSFSFIFAKNHKVSSVTSAKFLIYLFYFLLGANSYKPILVARFLKQKNPFSLPLGFSEMFTIEYRNREKKTFTDVNIHRRANVPLGQRSLNLISFNN